MLILLHLLILLLKIHKRKDVVYLFYHNTAPRKQKVAIYFGPDPSIFTQKLTDTFNSPNSAMILSNGKNLTSFLEKLPEHVQKILGESFFRVN